MMVTTSFTYQILQTRTRSLTGTVLLQTSHRARCCSHRWPRKLGRPRIHQGCWYLPWGGMGGSDTFNFSLQYHP